VALASHPRSRAIVARMSGERIEISARAEQLFVAGGQRSSLSPGVWSGVWSGFFRIIVSTTGRPSNSRRNSCRAFMYGFSTVCAGASPAFANASYQLSRYPVSLYRACREGRAERQRPNYGPPIDGSILLKCSCLANRLICSRSSSCSGMCDRGLRVIGGPH
jgi:hypothetical protein